MPFTSFSLHQGGHERITSATSQSGEDSTANQKWSYGQRWAILVMKAAKRKVNRPKVVAAPRARANKHGLLSTKLVTNGVLSAWNSNQTDAPWTIASLRLFVFSHAVMDQRVQADTWLSITNPPATDSWTIHLRRQKFQIFSPSNPHNGESDDITQPLHELASQTDTIPTSDADPYSEFHTYRYKVSSDTSDSFHPINHGGTFSPHPFGHLRWSLTTLEFGRFGLGGRRLLLWQYIDSLIWWFALRLLLWTIATSGFKWPSSIRMWISSMPRL